MVDFEGITFIINNEYQELELVVSKRSTVGALKGEIEKHWGLKSENQKLSCWHKTPENDNCILEEYSLPDVNYLVLHYEEENSLNVDNVKSERTVIPENSEIASRKKLEVMAAFSFLTNVTQNYNLFDTAFHLSCLQEALQQACFTSIETRKILLLYLHHKSDERSNVFLNSLNNPQIKEVLSRSYFILAWDIENVDYHSALIEALTEYPELNIVNLITSKVSTALLILPINDSITIFSCLRGKIAEGDILVTLKNAEASLRQEIQNENSLQSLANATSTENDFGSVEYQQLMHNMLGDRDYDSFEFDEHDYLKEKIGYSFFGQPKEETGYNKKQWEKINELYDVILRENNMFCEWKDRVIIAFIYNCTEPLPSEKLSRSKTYHDGYNPKTDLNPVPVFVLKKCSGHNDHCRIFIDHTCRVYENWTKYISRNALPACQMILPKNGRYQSDENDNIVLLEYHLSPACGVSTQIMHGVDIASTIAGLASGGVFIAAAIPAITVAPLALMAAGVTGLGVGAYAIGRSVSALLDRSRHKQDMSFGNSEARGAYLNIVAGSLGFVGAGANAAVAQLASRGFNIGQGATMAVNTINFMNIGASGISIANSGYDVYDQWYNENQTPSILTIVQLSSSVLFFGNAVYNYRSASVIIEESQSNTLQKFNDSLRSNRHRKTFNKLMKETIRQNNGNVQQGQAEIIAAIRNINNRDDVFAALTRSNRLFNRNDVRFSAVDGQIHLNGIPIDMMEFGTMNRNEVNIFITNLPHNPEPSIENIQQVSNVMRKSFNDIQSFDIVRHIPQLSFYLIKLFGDSNMKLKIMYAYRDLVKKLSDKLYQDCMNVLDIIFPNHQKTMQILVMVTDFFSNLVRKMEDQYQRWIRTGEQNDNEAVFVELSIERARRTSEIMNFIMDMYFNRNEFTERGLIELTKYFHTWFAMQLNRYQEINSRVDRRIQNSERRTNRINCTQCRGYYYT